MSSSSEGAVLGGEGRAVARLARELYKLSSPGVSTKTWKEIQD